MDFWQIYQTFELNDFASYIIYENGNDHRGYTFRVS